MRRRVFRIEGQRFRLSLDDLTNEFDIGFLDESGQSVLSIFRRARATGDMIVINCQEPGGNWGGELECAVDPSDTGALSLEFAPWAAELTLGARKLMRFNPERAFGPHVRADRIRMLQSKTGVRVRSFEDAANLHALLAPPPVEVTTTFDPSVALILLTQASREAIETRLGPDLGLFDELVILDPAEPDTLETVLGEKLETLRSQHVLLWSATTPGRVHDFAAALARYRAAQAPDAFMPFGTTPGCPLGKDWAVLLPRKVGTAPSFRVLAKRIIVDERLLSLGRWLLPPVWHETGKAATIRRASGLAPFRAGQVPGHVPRPLPQVCDIRLGASERITGGAQTAFSSIATEGLDTTHPVTLDAIVEKLRTALDTSFATHFCVSLATGMSRSRLGHWIGQSLCAEVFRLNGPEGGIVAIGMTRRVLTDLASAFDTGQHIGPLPPEDALEALDGLLPDIWDRHIETTGSVDALAEEPLFGAGTTWLLPPHDLNAILKPDEIHPRKGLQFASPEALDHLMISAICHGETELICDLVFALNEWAHENVVLQLTQVALRLMPDLGQDRILDVIQFLNWRFYYDECNAALDDIAASDIPLTPESNARCLEFRIKARTREDGHQAFSNVTLEELCEANDLPASPPPLLVQALAHYRLVRGNWAGVLALYDEITVPSALTPEFWRHYLIACLQTENLPLFDTHFENVAPQLDDWSAARLRIRRAVAENDPNATGRAVKRLLHSEKGMSRLLGEPTCFRHISGPDTALAPGGIGCVIVARNEFIRLKWLIEYYRHLGVERFVLIDNMSTDQTLAYFRQAPDITILQTDENYRDARFGVKWHNEAAARFMTGSWVATVDADEALVFDGSDRPGALRDLCARLDAAGDQAFFTTMIDMYSDAPYDRIDYTPGHSLIEAFDHFDGEGYWFDPVAACPGWTVSGGVRIRVFWDNRHAMGKTTVAMQKAPLVKWSPEFMYLTSTHEMTPLRVSAERGALLHFKFLPDFHQRSMEEVERKQHYAGAREYRVYARRMSNPEHRSLAYSGSVRYQGPETLMRLGLIGNPGGGDDDSS